MKLKEVAKTALAMYGLCKLTGDLMDKSLDRLLTKMEDKIRFIHEEKLGRKHYIFEADFREVD